MPCLGDDYYRMKSNGEMKEGWEDWFRLQRIEKAMIRRQAKLMKNGPDKSTIGWMNYYDLTEKWMRDQMLLTASRAGEQLAERARKADEALARTEAKAEEEGWPTYEELKRWWKYGYLYDARFGSKL